MTEITIDVQQIKILRENLLLKLKQIKSRNSATTETKLFVQRLPDEEFPFGEWFKNKALKRSANKEVYKEILEVFNQRLTEEEFVKINRHDFPKHGYEIFMSDTKKLQIKYSTFKRKWREMKHHPRKGSSLVLEELRPWYWACHKIGQHCYKKMFLEKCYFFLFGSFC